VDPADLGISEASALIASGGLSASELVGACLARIRERDGACSHLGDPDSVNAWVRVYEEEAVAAAGRLDGTRRASTDARPALWGIPIGLKDLYAVAGHPLTASSSLLDERPQTDCDVWARLQAQGMVLLGHLHTHEFAFGGTTDQVGNPWSLAHTAGGSSGGSAAALAARMVPAATGTDTAGSLRIPSALSGTSTIKPTRGRISLRGVVPLATSLDHAGPMARSLEDCALLLAGMGGPDAGRPLSALVGGVPALPSLRVGPRPLAGTRLALSPRAGVDLEADVADGLELALERLRALGATLIEPPPPDVPLDVADDYLDVLAPEFLAYHRRFDDRRERYRPSIREWVDVCEQRGVSAERYVAVQQRRRETTAGFAEWLARERISALVEPTEPCVAPLRGDGYDHAGSDAALISLTYYWDWTGFPVAALPAAVGTRSGLPVGVSLIGPAGSDWDLLDMGMQLQGELGVPDPYAAR
jgi:aspartyl-tRNA(Asn)/glutamyl-tRNA(Gln) amidotransferase subunit A